MPSIQFSATTSMPTRPAFLAAVALTLAAACGAPPVTDDAAVASVRSVTLVAADVVTAATGDLTTGVLLTGMLEPAVRVVVAAQVEGTVGAIAVDRGTAVTRGGRLTTLVAEGVRANAAAAEASLAVARTRRDAAKRLYEAGATSKVDYENAEAMYRAAEAQAAGARESAGFADVTSPITGAVSERKVESGQAVRVGDAMFTIVSTTELELAGHVPVDEASAIRIGQEVRFSIDAMSGRTFTGRVTRKDPVADGTTRQVGVYARVANPQGAITAGQYARGEVAGRTLRNIIRLPETALRGAGDDTYVFVLAEGKISRRAVVVAARSTREGVVAIESGITAGDVVIARPTPGLSDNQPAVLSGDK
jgi:RND family efflux transporter MFP subunit